MKVKEESEKVGLAQHSEKEDHGIWAHHFMANRCGNSERLYFWGLQNHCRWWLQPWNLKTLAPWKKGYDQPRQHIKKQRHYFVRSLSHVQLFETPWTAARQASLSITSSRSLHKFMFIESVTPSNCLILILYVNKGPSSQSYGFSSSHVWMGE